MKSNRLFLVILSIALIMIFLISNITYAAGTDEDKGAHSIGEIISEGQDFIKAGDTEKTIDGTVMQNASSTIYNILLAVGIVTAVIISAILGIKFMTGGIEEQAEVKKSIAPFIVGCCIIFGAFTIWKLVLTLTAGLK